MNQFKKAAIIFVFFLGLIVLVHFSIFFGVLTFCISLLVLGRAEFEKNVHELAFYVRGELPTLFKTWFRYYGWAEVFVKSIVLGIMSIFLFSGTDGIRILSLAFLVSLCTVFGYFVLRFVENHAHIDVTRWGYVRFSVVLGLIFSVLCSSVPGIGKFSLSWQVVRSMGGREFSFEEISELMYSLTYEINGLISKMLHQILGDLLGGFLSVIISVNVIYGFVIVVYSLLLLRLVSPQSPRAPAPISASAMS